MRRALVMLALGAGIALADGATLRDAWIALPPPGATVAAGYLVIDNASPDAVCVVGVRVAGFASAELHESLQDGARMSMRPRDELLVAAGSRFALAPGGVHLMLFRPAAPLVAGRSHTVTLMLVDGRELTVAATVRDARAAGTVVPHSAHR